MLNVRHVVAERIESHLQPRVEAVLKCHAGRVEGRLRHGVVLLLEGEDDFITRVCILQASA